MRLIFIFAMLSVSCAEINNNVKVCVAACKQFGGLDYISERGDRCICKDTTRVCFERPEKINKDI